MMKYCGLVIDDDVYDEDPQGNAWAMCAAALKRTDTPRSRIMGEQKYAKYVESWRGMRLFCPSDRKWFNLKGK